MKITIRRPANHSSHQLSENKEYKPSDFRGLSAYRQKHGEHFTQQLAEYASKQLVNRNGAAHYWSPQDVASAVARAGGSLTAKNMYDAHYLANMIYSDYFQSSLKTEGDVIQQVVDYMNDPDGSETMAFNQFVAKLMAKKIEFPWENYL